MACGTSSEIPELYFIVRHWAKVIRGVDLPGTGTPLVLAIIYSELRKAAVGSTSLLGGGLSALRTLHFGEHCMPCIITILCLYVLAFCGVLHL
jgi:hypothetical protein